MSQDQFAIWWIKRDIRLNDNQALTAALASGLPVLPVYVFEPDILFAPESSSIHAHAQLSALAGLQDSVSKRNGKIWISVGRPEDAFSKLSTLGKICGVYSQEETGTETTFSRDRRMAVWFKAHGLEWREYSQGGVIRRIADRTERDRLRAAFYLEEPLSCPNGFPALPPALNKSAFQPLPNLQELGFKQDSHTVQRVSEQDAGSVIRSFRSRRSSGYRYLISSPNSAFEHGSRISPHLAWGTVSARSVLAATKAEREAAGTSQSHERDLAAFSSRIHWRDHFMQRLECEPRMETRPINPLFNQLPYTNDPALLQAWLDGATGFALIDACMRCLSRTGFLNFRMRALVVSFATYALRLDWRTINAPLARLMLDYEPGIHISQLQMQAGVTGINAMRTYSPAKQLRDQDPDLTFTRNWVPELRTLSDDLILNAGNGPIPGYVVPVVAFAEQTKLMKDAVYAVKRSSENRLVSLRVLEVHGSRRGPLKRRHTPNKQG